MWCINAEQKWDAYIQGVTLIQSLRYVCVCVLARVYVVPSKDWITILYVDWLLIIPTDDITLAALGILPYLVPDVRYKADMSKIVYLAKVITYIIIRYLIG